MQGSKVNPDFTDKYDSDGDTGSSKEFCSSFED